MRIKCSRSIVILLKPQYIETVLQLATLNTFQIEERNLNFRVLTRAVRQYLSMKEFFLIWESSCRNFIDDLEFSCQEAKESRLKIHVFLRSDTPEKAMPPQRDWIETHFSLTTCPYASDAAILLFLLERYAKAKTERREEFDAGSTLVLVADKERKFEEVTAILRNRNPELQVIEINGREQSILEVLDNVCRRCKLVFLSKPETEEHFYLLHNYFCYNQECLEGRFYTESELQKHIESQSKCPLCKEEFVFCREEKRRAHMKIIHKIDEMLSPARKTPISECIDCQFCPHKKFTSTQQKEIHMKNCHKKCNCSCGNYFNTRDDYLDHFYSIYPLACFENRKCPHRFQSALYQAKHHREDHFSTQPFYCIPCHHQLANEGYKSKVCFKDEKSLRIHGMSLGHQEDEMFLTEVKESLKTEQPFAQRRVPSRACSAINYC